MPINTFKEPAVAIFFLMLFFFLPLNCLNASSHIGFGFANSIHFMSCHFESKTMFLKLFAPLLPKYYYFSGEEELCMHTDTACADGLS